MGSRVRELPGTEARRAVAMWLQISLVGRTFGERIVRGCVSSLLQQPVATLSNL